MLFVSARQLPDAATGFSACTIARRLAAASPHQIAIQPRPIHRDSRSVEWLHEQVSGIHGTNTVVRCAVFGIENVEADTRLQAMIVVVIACMLDRAGNR